MTSSELQAVLSQVKVGDVLRVRYLTHHDRVMGFEAAVSRRETNGDGSPNRLELGDWATSIGFGTLTRGAEPCWYFMRGEPRRIVELAVL
jgi:hypothetical protein